MRKPRTKELTDTYAIVSFNKQTRENNKPVKKNIIINKDEIDITHYRSITIDLNNPILENYYITYLKTLARLIDTEITFTIEHKMKNNMLHLHGYFECKLPIEEIRKQFMSILYGIHHKVDEIFSLEGWKSYITKEFKTIESVKP